MFKGTGISMLARYHFLMTDIGAKSKHMALESSTVHQDNVPHSLLKLIGRQEQPTLAA